VGCDCLEVKRERTRERERNERERAREIGIETRTEGIRDIAGEGEPKKGVWHGKCSIAGK